MRSASALVKGATAGCTVILVTATLWVVRGYVWPTLSNVEVGPLQAMLNPALFREDFTVQEALRFSPRFYYNALILLPAQAGLPLAWSFAAWHLAALALLVSAGRAFAVTMGLAPVIAAVLLVWLLTVNAGTLGAVYFYTYAPVPAVWAGAVAAWGAVFAVRGNCPAAFACFGVAALLQFLVGFYAGLLALPAWLAASRPDRIRAVCAWGAGLALVYVPLAITGRADAGALSSDAFVEIYAQLRHPHHLVPSSWPWPLWQRAGAFYLGAWYFLHRTAAGRPALERKLLHTTLALTAAALAVNYLFVEVYPTALVAKLQPARITPLAQAIILGLLARRAQAWWAQRAWLPAAALCLIPLSPLPGVLLVLAAILLPSPPPQPAPSLPAVGWPAVLRWPAVLLVAAVVLAFRPFGGSLGYQMFRYGPPLAMVLVQLVPAWLQGRRLLLAGVTALAAGGAAHCAVASSRQTLSPLLAARFAVDAPPTDAPGLLGLRFRGRSPLDALVLAPPTSEPWSFKLHARRALVVDDKNIPFTVGGLREWHARMERVLGVPYVRGINAAEAWRAQGPEALRAVAAQYGARFILTRDVWHPTLPGLRRDEEQGWTLWELAEPSKKSSVEPRSP